MLENIDYIVFDFGEVLIELDYPLVIEGFLRVANKNHEDIKEMVVTAPLLQEFEVGAITAAEFRGGVNSLLGTHLEDEELDSIWNSILKRLPKERMELLQRVAQRFPTYILSNTNHIHELAFNRIIEEVTGKHSLHEFVKKCYFSHDIGFRKPNADCYRYLIEDSGIIAEKALFLDDREDNIQSARQVGLNAIQITNADAQLTEIFGRD